MTDRILEHLPRIDILAMGHVTRVPDWYCDDGARPFGRSSIDRLRALAPATLYFSHDDESLPIE